MNRIMIEKGFTLVELVIVVAIVGVLSSLAFFNFGESASKAKRTDGRSKLLETATSLEKCKAVYGTYDNAGCNVGNGDSIDSTERHYTISVDTTATTFDLKATPQGGQASDSCTQITLNHLLQQGGSPSADDCW